MASTTTSTPAETVNHCATHPDVESELQCGRCGKYICPRCMVQTPVGARCRECARLRRPPMYTLSPLNIARVVGAGLGLGVAFGLLWGLLVPQVGLFGFFMLFVGMFAGYGMANALDWAGGRKRGVIVQAAAIGGIVVAYLVRNMVADGQPIVPNDVWGLIFVAIAAVTAWNRLR
jgi:hypothetical protein